MHDTTSSVRDMYEAAYAEHGRSPASVLCPKGRQNLRYEAILSKLNLAGKKILDFGCGLGDLALYLDQQNIDCHYTGVDIVGSFVKDNSANIENHEFYSIESIADIKGKFDVVVSCGVFNIRYEDDFENNFAYVLDQVSQLFKLADEALCIDFLSSHVDFEAESAFHVEPGRMLENFMNKLTRRVHLNHAYLPYEYCLTAISDSRIDRESSCFSNAG